MRKGQEEVGILPVLGSENRTEFRFNEVVGKSKWHTQLEYWLGFVCTQVISGEKSQQKWPPLCQKIGSVKFVALKKL